MHGLPPHTVGSMLMRFNRGFIDSMLRIQIGEDRHRPPGFLFERPDRCDDRRLVVVAAVAEIEPEHVDPGLNQMVDLFSPPRWDFSNDGVPNCRSASLPSHFSFRALPHPRTCLFLAPP